MHWYLHAWTHYFDFKTRASRMEFWLFLLINFLVTFVLAMIDGVLQAALGTVSMLQFLFSLIAMIPTISVTVRRLHDFDRTGWWALLMVVPLVNFVAMIVIGVISGTARENRFGPNPWQSAVAKAGEPAA